MTVVAVSFPVEMTLYVDLERGVVASSEVQTPLVASMREQMLSEVTIGERRFTAPAWLVDRALDVLDTPAGNEWPDPTLVG